MAKIAFVIAPEYTRTMPHLGIAYLRSMAALHNHQTCYFDFSALYRTDKIFSSILKTWMSTFSKVTSMQTFFTFLPSVIHYFEPSENLPLSAKTHYLFLKAESAKMAIQILDFQPDTVCFSIYNTTLFLSLSIAREIKARNSKIKIILGGPFLNDERTQEFVLLFKDYVDHLVLGEGEYIINDIAENKIPVQQRVICSEAIQKLDALPFPTFEGCDFATYYKVMVTEKNWRGLGMTHEKILPVMALRGCPYNCAFCDHHVVWKEYRGRSIDNVIAEIIHQQNIYDCRIFRFNDSLLNSNPQWLKELCEALLDNKITIYWYGHCRADKIDNELALLMYRAGCRYIKFGIESGSHHVLKLMNKRITPMSARKAITAAHDAGIKVRASFIYAYPGETQDNLFETVTLMQEIADKLYGVRVYSFMFMPGTELELQTKKHHITLNCFEVPGSKFSTVLSAIPETWSHPEINSEEISIRAHLVQPITSQINKDESNYIPYMFSEAIKLKLEPYTLLMYQNKAIAARKESNAENENLITVFATSGASITLSKELVEFIENNEKFNYKDLFLHVTKAAYLAPDTAEKLIIALISTGVLQIIPGS